MTGEKHHNATAPDTIEGQDLGTSAGPNLGEPRVMNQSHEVAAESAATIAAKLAPPATVSIATVAGYHVSEIVLWLTGIYTLLMIVHKLVVICRDIWGKK